MMCESEKGMILILGAILATTIVIGLGVVLAWYVRLWLMAYWTGTSIGFVDLVLMSLRQVSPKEVVQCEIMAVQSGLPFLPLKSLEAQYLAGGDIRRVTLAVIAADRAGIALDWDKAAAIDLAGRNILDAVQTSVLPKVIICPDPSDARSNALLAVAKDGIQLKVSVRVTVRTNLLQLIGGATESTVLARVGQSVIAAIGACDHYHEALRDPMLITRQAISRNLDSDTAFAVVSIDIAEIEVGRNIGAKLQIDQAGADFRVALALAETRRCSAMAKEQEMRAKCMKSRMHVTLAESTIPPALAEAFRRGQIRKGGLSASPASKRKPLQQFPNLPLLRTLVPGGTKILPT